MQRLINILGAALFVLSLSLFVHPWSIWDNGQKTKDDSAKSIITEDQWEQMVVRLEDKEILP